ncbi:hypothetical protein F442_15123 [Phytophthora nicotianae P10297]|uniref:Uncharacterized protein n=3 Tax=Phytophthora nicotianae TaxID=4792 RepID=W2R0H4_PHYN3|nr:hypothetical protein PPTG_21727 [Phytophthora nicotianae INRA-310]ETL85979.1 hypothetical protein L917_14547 [Phytophthora nicotianae]ETN18015.1 hypothetical protein PPTG_21727 [Phytophthora nicotianae INRA-310]ETP37035.1 hypothetical protein F442_15123 [Phytophthora nicotianae P10297]
MDKLNELTTDFTTGVREAFTTDLRTEKLCEMMAVRVQFKWAF